ncbi:hypothetical protein [Streptomyces lunaelactis]|uniref:hypothetical protein n=1 Tax=Streptomyces lunaelactis TaxID=1535768 RepID=UPI0015844D74|nr:hypothetical protein [Streptomyces lunaelactis]NUK03225.1 hypothetical protein [Streptomyces lunaelactis]NUK18217.1 hypothetical protein [Streptomyces lunaelactis]
MSSSEDVDNLSRAESAFILNAFEIDVLPGVRGDLDEPLASAPGPELATVLMPLIDRGWIEVCRIIPWTSPEGKLGDQPGPPIPREVLPALLADADNWEYPDSRTWTGCLTLVLTERGRQISW